MYGLLGLILLACALLTVGQSDNAMSPAADSYEPAGTRAFAELLAKQGYKTITDRSRKPEIRPGDLVIAFHKTEADGLEFVSRGASNKPQETPEEAVYKRVIASTKGGANVLVAELPVDFGKVSQQITGSEPQRFSNTLSGEVLSILTDEGTSLEPEVPVWVPPSNSANALVQVDASASGTIAFVRSPVPFTNRFIDRADNARFALSMVKMLAHPGARIIFAEACWSNAVDKGLFATIGQWALLGYYQVLFVLALVIITANIRFGFPDELRVEKRGTRALVDAVGFTLRRGRRTQTAVSVAADRLERSIRSTLRLPADASAQEVDRFTSDDLKEALRSLRLASAEHRVASSAALSLIVSAQERFDEWVTSRQGT